MNSNTLKLRKTLDNMMPYVHFFRLAFFWIFTVVALLLFISPLILNSGAIINTNSKNLKFETSRYQKISLRESGDSNTGH